MSEGGVQEDFADRMMMREWHRSEEEERRHEALS